MTTEIKQLDKAAASGYGFQMSDWVQPADVRNVVKPGLITALVGAKFVDVVTDTFTYDKQVKTVSLPQVKSKTEKGGTQQADGASQLAFTTGSFGTGATVMTQDWVNRRKVGGTPFEMMSEDDAVAEMIEKFDLSWDLHTEQGLRTCITGDTNLLAIGGGSNIHPSYNYSLAINGVSRVEETVNIAGATSDVANRFTMAGKVQEIRQQLSILGMSSSKMVVLCSGEFFQARYNSEAQLNVNRELRATIDLGTSAIPGYNLNGFDYFNFTSSDGCMYIDVSGEIIAGQPLIAANKAYMMPMVSGLLEVRYSPSLRRGFAGRPALPMYAFAKESDYGIEVLTESNRLYFSPHPQLIKALTLP